jgi:hypothetical protein
MWTSVKRAGEWYSRCLSHSPYITNCVTGFIVAGAGDALCQRYFEGGCVDQHRSIDKRRVVEMGLIRAAVITPFTLKWYTILARIAPGATLVSALKRVAVDQVIGSPIVISLVFTAKALLAGEPWTAQDTIKRSLVETWCVGLQYWPVMHTINFRFVPLMYQPLYASFVSLYWNAVLSYYANGKNTTSRSDVAVIDSAEGIQCGHADNLAASGDAIKFPAIQHSDRQPN